MLPVFFFVVVVSYFLFLPSLFLLFLYFIYFWLHEVFIATRQLSLAEASGGTLESVVRGFSSQWLLSLQSTDSRVHGLRGVVHGLSCLSACGSSQTRN